jgi:hypothetical protein
MPYPKWLDWDVINQAIIHDENIITHFRGTDGYPACGCELSSRQKAAARSTSDPHEVTCGRCVRTVALNKVA